MDKELLGQRMRQLREENHYTKKYVADSVGMSETHYSQCERGIKLLSVEYRLKLSKFYSIELDYLTEENYDPFKSLSAIEAFPGFVRKLPLGEQTFANGFAKLFMESFKDKLINKKDD